MSERGGLAPAGRGLRRSAKVVPSFGGEFDPFVWYRWLLGIFGATYAVVMSLRGLWRVLAYLSGASRDRVMLRRVVTIQLLRLKIRPFLGELAQVGMLIAALACCLWLHHHLGLISP